LSIAAFLDPLLSHKNSHSLERAVAIDVQYYIALKTDDSSKIASLFLLLLLLNGFVQRFLSLL
jgi:hypothetical protein